MLPSTGLFKTIVCPYFETDGCTRPYCHFKHARKDEEAANKPATYTPSPTPAPQLLTLPEPVKKKVKLEYVPTKPTINDAPPKADYVSKSLSAPVYIPSNTATAKQEDGNDDDEHSRDSVIICGDEPVPSEKVEPESPKAVVSSDVITLSDDDDGDDDYDRPEDDTEELNNTEEFAIPSSEPVNITNGEKKSEPEKPKDKDKERRHSSSSRSHSSSHKSSRSASSSKHKSSRDRDKSSSHSKDRDKDKDREKERSSSKSKDHHSTSSSSKPSSHRSHSKSSGGMSKTRSSKDESTSHKKSSSGKGSSSSSRRSSSKSKSSHRKRSRSKERSSRSSDVRSAKEPKLDNDVMACISYETTSDEEEEDVMAQCKALYEEFTSKTPQDQTPTTPTQTAPVHTPQESTYEDARERKKWLAHDKTGNAKPLIQAAPRKSNHMKSAMQSIFKRQEIVRQQQEEAAAAKAEEERKRAEEEKKRAEAKAKEESTLTPLISRNYPQPVRPPVRIFAPASNVLAIERAKKKVEELRAQKQMTPCKTASKVGGRVAHNSTTATEQSQPAPPVLEASSSKISYNLRMQYYNMMVKHCLNIYPTCDDAWDRAQTEELAVFKKCSTPVIYKSSALLAINKLRKESIDAGNINTEKNKTVSHEVILAGKLAQSNAWSINKKKVEEISTSNEPVDKLPGTKVYELVAECILTDEQLVANGYPRPGPKPGTAIIKETRSKPKPPNPNERYCSRCAKLFDLSIYDDPPMDECNYHPKSTGYRRGFADNMHRCCQQPAGTPGCTYADYHISEFVDYNNLTGFVTTIDYDKSVPTRKDIFALDCEMCYTTMGMELTRVTVVDMNGKTVYDALVKPDNKIIDYNTTYSGITEDMLKNEKRTLRDIQAVILSMFHSKTILIGHSLESDLKALKLIHNMVVDTSVLYPHKMGPPYKRALKTLCIEYLKRIIQENEHGHDSAEDAEVCIQLVKYYLRNKIT